MFWETRKEEEGMREQQHRETTSERRRRRCCSSHDALCVTKKRVHFELSESQDSLSSRSPCILVFLPHLFLSFLVIGREQETLGKKEDSKYHKFIKIRPLRSCYLSRPQCDSLTKRGWMKQDKVAPKLQLKAICFQVLLVITSRAAPATFLSIVSKVKKNKKKERSIFKTEDSHWSLEEEFEGEPPFTWEGMMMMLTLQVLLITSSSFHARVRNKEAHTGHIIQEKGSEKSNSKHGMLVLSRCCYIITVRSSLTGCFTA